MQPGWRQPSLDTSQLPYGRCLIGPHRRSVWLAPTLQSLSRVYKTKIFSPFLFTRCALSTAVETAALRQIASKLSRTLGGAQRKAGYSRRSLLRSLRPSRATMDTGNSNSCLSMRARLKKIVTLLCLFFFVVERQRCALLLCTWPKTWDEPHKIFQGGYWGTHCRKQLM
jgi:hypothetical protein